MAQVTQSLVDEWKRSLAMNRMPAFTGNEFGQLCFAWEEAQGLRAQVKELTLQALADSGQAVDAHAEVLRLREIVRDIAGGLRTKAHNNEFVKDSTLHSFADELFAAIAASRADGGAG